MLTGSLLAWLILGHLTGDFLFQTGWMARNKEKDLLALLAHGAVYTATVWLFTLPFQPLAWPQLSLILLTHLILDRRKFTAWWVRSINQAENIPWLFLVIDQCLHLLVLAAVALSLG